MISPVHGDLRSPLLAYLNEDIPVPVIIESIGVGDLVLLNISGPLSRLLNELLVGEAALRVLVQELHVGVGGCRVEVVVQLFDVFSMVA